MNKKEIAGIVVFLLLLGEIFVGLAVAWTHTGMPIL